jgi:predicted DNA-binding transcriptional regulator AlpA
MLPIAVVSFPQPTGSKGERAVTENDHLITRRAVAERTTVSVDTLVRWARQGIGPKPIKLGPRRVGYSAAEVEKWLEQCQRST